MGFINRTEKTRAFTLIELLAVILILAIIALIAVPIILNIVEKARKGAFEDSAYGVVDAVKLYYADASLDGGISTETFTFPTDTKLKLTGEKPKSGSAVLEEDGKVSLVIGNGTWCAKKDKDEEKVTIVDYSVGDCEIGEVVPPVKTCFTVNEEDPSEITGYTCDEKDIEIPASINGVVIKKIGPRAFTDKSLTSVVIPEGIESIEHLSFSNNLLQSIIIPSGVKSIGESAFSNNLLQSVTIPESVTRIAVGAFENNQLQSATILGNVTSIEAGVFANNQLINIEIPNTVIDIQSDAFLNNQLTSIIIPNGVTSIGSFAFGRNLLTSIEISGSVTSIEEAAFNNNQLPDNQAFIYKRNNDGTEDKSTVISYGGKKRDNVSVPNNVKYINNFAFMDNQLTSVTIPSSVMSIGENVFIKNASGMKVTVDKVPDSITGAPWGASSVEWLQSCFTVSETDPSMITRYICEKTDVEIPSSINGVEIKILGVNAFCDKELTSVVIPDTVTDIQSYAFYNNQLSNITLPNSVTYIGYTAFWGNQLSSVTIPGNVKDISIGAFANTQLQSVEIQYGVEIIKREAFGYNQLTSVIIPSSVTSIGENAFVENASGMKVIVNKPKDSISGAPWGASSVEWTG